MTKKYMVHDNNVSFNSWLMSKNNELGYPLLDTATYTTGLKHPEAEDSRIVCLVKVNDIPVGDRADLLNLQQAKVEGWFVEEEIQTLI